MKRRLMVAKAMVHNPPVLILDEPTAGVDVELRSNLWNSIKKLNKTGTTIILTTHYLKEAELLCDEIAVINKGRVIANDSKQNLLNILDEKEIKIEFVKKINDIPEKIRDYCTKQNDHTIILKFNKSKLNTAELIKGFVNNKSGIRDISTKESDLEDIFIKLLKKLIFIFFLTLSSCVFYDTEQILKESQKNNNNNFKYMRWSPEIESNEIILAIHGFNDYSNAFDIPGKFLFKLWN